MTGSPAARAPHQGLGHFDAPRYLNVDPVDPTEPRAEGSVEGLRGRTLVVRVTIGLVIAGGAPLLLTESTSVVRLGWLIAGVWLPVVVIIDVAGRRTGRRTGGVDLLWDLLLWVAVDAVVDQPTLSATGYLLTVAHHAYLGGRRFAVTAGLAAILAILAVPLATGHDRPGLGTGVQVLAVAMLVWLLAEASGRHSTTRTGLVRVAERSEAILGGIADAVVVTSPGGRIRQWNRASERVFGRSADDAVRRSCPEVLALIDQSRPLRCAGGCELLARGGDDIELWRTGSQGQRQSLLASATAVLDEEGHPVEVIHSFRDISSVKAADEAKTLFLATASHELKTPLTVIQGSAQLLRREGLDPADRERMVAAIQSRAGQLAGIVDRLLMSSRIEAGMIDLDLAPVDLGPLLEERCRALSVALERSISLALEPGAAAVDADPDALTTVIDHLLDNACKYSPEGGLISVSVGRDGDDHAVVALTDRGVGMTPEQVARCFDRFWQAESTDVRRFGGTGIGLYIVRSLVEAMGGTVTATSRPGEGTTFAVCLWTAGSAPVVDLPADDDRGTDARVEAGEAQQSMIREYMRQVGVPLSGAAEGSGRAR